MDPTVHDFPTMLKAIQNFFTLATPQMPPEAWWVAAVVLATLAAAAIIDIFTGTIPDVVIFCGMVFIVGLQGMYVDFPFAAHQMTWGLVALAVVWAVNELWHRIFKHDALGMGDGKWTMLAVTCFGGVPLLVAWGVGAVIGSVVIGMVMLVRRKMMRVHFAPFLFAGLLVGLWVVRMGGYDLLSTRLNGGM